MQSLIFFISRIFSTSKFTFYVLFTIPTSDINSNLSDYRGRDVVISCLAGESAALVIHGNRGEDNFIHHTVTIPVRGMLFLTKNLYSFCIVGVNI